MSAPSTTRPTSALEQLHPSYFAMVMATGIVSVACHLLGFAALARLLFWFNPGFYLVLWALLLLRIVRYPTRVASDLTSHGRGVGFFTMVAGTCVLGTQFLLIGQNFRVAAALWFIGIALWALQIYTVFSAITIKAAKPVLADGINGGWLVSVVAAQSVAVLGAQLSAGFGAGNRPGVLFFCLAMWLGGGMLYIWIISLIFYRYTFFALSPADLSPPYWVNMGAVAISALAGTMLIANSGGSPVLTELLPFIKGFTLFFWATATWWIPMLLILGCWRHLYMRFPLRYDPLYWDAVFPLGMYTACTTRLAGTLPAQFLMPIPRAFIYIALAAWGATFVGLLVTLVGSVSTRKALEEV
jgi:tellurite resistance protein TehA-like permease